ncbi:MAG: MMPL family transporter [bacterium]|nr:MMPL family transporter [bacterium]
MVPERRALALGALILGAAIAWLVIDLRVVTDIAHFLPDGAAADEVHLAREIAAGELGRTMVVLVDAPDTATAVAASRSFEAALREEPRVAAELAFLDAGPPSGLEEALWAIYEPRRFGFLAVDAESARERLAPAALADAATELKRKLATPMSSLLSRVAPGDPLLILPTLFERLMAGRGEGLGITEGRFVTADGRAAVMFLATHSPASDGTKQRPFLAGLEAAFARVDDEFDGTLTLGMSGTNRFAVRAESAIRGDIQRVSIGSTIGLVFFLLVVFRSLRLVVLVLPVVGSAFVAGALACQWLFGHVHGLTLAFGAALIGVTIDYAVHFHCHHAFAPDPNGPRATLRGIWSPLVLGAATTVTGFLALMVSAFPGLRQLAVFAVFGILGAVLATRVFLPGLAARSAKPTRVGCAIVAGMRAVLEVRASRRRWLWLPLGLVIAIAGIGLPQLRWNDDIAALNRLDPELLAADAAVRDRVVRYEQGRLVVALGADEEAALAVNDEVARVLDEAVASGKLTSYRSLSALVPSAARQRAVDHVVRNTPGLWAATRDAFVAAGFVAEAFEPFRSALAAEPPAPLVPGDLASTPLEPLARPFRITLDDRVGFVSFLHGLVDPAALQAAVETVPGGRLVAIEGALTTAYGAYRERMLQLWLIGLAGVLGLVLLRHRAVRPTLMAWGPAVAAAAGTLGLLALCGVELNMLSLVALLMVVSMGVDYGVFLTENHREERRLSATHLAVAVAGISTVLGFGLLALSEQPPLRSIGLTSGVGVLLCLVLAPTVCAALARPPQSEAGGETSP